MKRLLRNLGKKLRKIKCRRLRAWSRWVTRRVTRERGYVEAVVLLGVEFVDLFCRSKVLRRLSRKAALMVLAVLRALLHSDDIYPRDHFDDGPIWA